MVNRYFQNKWMTMSHDDGLWEEEKQNSVMDIKDEVGKEAAIFFTKMVRDILFEKMSGTGALRDLRDEPR